MPSPTDSVATTLPPATPIARPVIATPPLPVVPLLETLGPGIGDRTRGIVLGSESRLAAALVLGSPDFMRR